jgi:uncharacterized membrane protein YkvA (DUF1232 family)
MPILPHRQLLGSLPMLQRLRGWAHRIKRDAVALWFARSHPATPWYAKALGMFVVAYALSPIDLIPDFIPVLGLVDDLMLLPALIWLCVKLLPAQVLLDSRRRAEQWLQQQHERPRSRAGAAAIVLIWAASALALWLWLV